jgi:hypothetical protein
LTKLFQLCWKHCDNLEKVLELRFKLQALKEVMNVRFQSFFFGDALYPESHLGPSSHFFPRFDSNIDSNSDDGLQCSGTCGACDGRWKFAEPMTYCHFEFIGEGVGR